MILIISSRYQTEVDCKPVNEEDKHVNQTNQEHKKREITGTKVGLSHYYKVSQIPTEHELHKEEGLEKNLLYPLDLTVGRQYGILLSKSSDAPEITSVTSGAQDSDIQGDLETEDVHEELDKNTTSPFWKLHDMYVQRDTVNYFPLLMTGYLYKKINYYGAGTQAKSDLFEEDHSAEVKPLSVNLLELQATLNENEKNLDTLHSVTVTGESQRLEDDLEDILASVAAKTSAIKSSHVRETRLEIPIYEDQDDYEFKLLQSKQIGNCCYTVKPNI